MGQAYSAKWEVPVVPLWLVLDGVEYTCTVLEPSEPELPLGMSDSE